ncbi:hypothetical protein K8R43_05185 [archaeon]|nr:hypothetical protein [archaeon]
MKYNHLKVLRGMVERGIVRSKIFGYFRLEGYSDEQIEEELSVFERSLALRKKPSDPPPVPK